MTVITTRNDLLDVVRKHAPSNACETAMREGRVCVLGGYQEPDSAPCWTVWVQSRSGQSWFVRVYAYETTYGVCYGVPPDPLYWIGQSDGKRPLIDGDMAQVMAFDRMKAASRKRKCPTLSS